jgi:hypothetical protein
VLQWNDPFGGSANDYDLALFDPSSLALLALSASSQTGTQDPIEVVQMTNVSGTPRAVGAAIEKASGADRMLEMFCIGGAAEEYVTISGSIFGHAGLPEVVAVGAIDVGDPGLDDVEGFSSRGPAFILLPAAATRPKPDLAGFDGVSISNAGGFPSCPPSCTFFGTSAAAPHAAAVAALLRQKNPFLTPAEIQAALRAGAVDVGPAGFDDAAGAGRLDAVAAARLVPVPECFTDAACADGDACTLDACSRGTCTHPPTPCDDGNACNGQERCDPARGCLPGEPPSCADTDPCTADSCDPASGCMFPELPGLAYVSCALESHLRPLLPLPGSAPSRRAARTATRILARLDAAERHVTRASGGRRGPARKRLARARKALATIRALARKREADLGATIVRPIVLETLVIASKIRVVQRSL